MNNTCNKGGGGGSREKGGGGNEIHAPCACGIDPWMNVATSKKGE